MISSSPFLTQKSERRCILCDCTLEKKDMKLVHLTGFQGIKNNAELWSQLDERVCMESPYRSFREVVIRLPTEFNDPLFIHKSCGITFRNRLKSKQEQSQKLQDEMDETDIEKSNERNDVEARKRILREKEAKRICFICNKKSECDEKPYNDGGLARCCQLSSAERLTEQMEKKISQEGDRYYEAAKRLDIFLNGTSHDVFAADVFYHKGCYGAFTYVSKESQKNDETEKIKLKVFENFNDMFKCKVIQEKESYLMIELLKDLEEISQDFGLETPPIRFTSHLKRHLKDAFQDLISFSTVAGKLVVSFSELGPITYVNAALKGHGLREDDLTRAFARLVRRKLESKQPFNWPPTPDKLSKALENFTPLPCIFNAIAWSVSPNAPKNDFGLVTVGKSYVQKISAISQSWQGMASNDRAAPLNIALGLTVHRVTGSKETARLLHHAGLGISYSDIRLLNNTWANAVKMKHKHMLPPGFFPGKTLHVTFDNSDGRQQTLTGSSTTHHTTGTVFQISATNVQSTEIVSATMSDEMEIIDEEEPDYGFFKIPRNRKEPSSFPGFKDETKESPLIKEAFEKDAAWVVVSAIGLDCVADIQGAVDVEEIEPIGSWTNFMKQVTSVKTTKCKLEYLPVVPLPPSDNVIKWYMDAILQMVDDLSINHIFVHADEAINSKMVIISWMHEGRYDKIITLMGGFHTVLVNLKVLGKKYGCIGLNSWWIDSKVIAEGSAVQAMEGRHYHRGVRLHKQSFEALLRYRILKLSVMNDITAELRQRIADLRIKPSSETLAAVIQQPEFKILLVNLLHTTGTQSKMIVEYIRDVSAMLCLISSVREHSIERHLAAERALIPKCFAFGHPNYSRYLTYQHVRLLDIKSTERMVWDDLVKNGFGGSLSGEPFSTIHGDLITETTINREVKVKGGPMQGGFSTDVKTVDTFLKTSHIIADLRGKLKERLNVLSNSSHKETTKGAKKKHEEMINSLVGQLDNYFDPFLVGAARNFKTGMEIDPATVDGLLSSHVKQLTQLRRGTPGKRVYISSSQQSMPSGKAWQTFLHNSENKTELIHFLVEFMKENRNLLRIPTIVTENEKSWLLTTKAVIQLDNCNHIEADTRLIYVASTANSPVIIRAADTDVLILMVFVYREMREHQWQMKIERDSYVNIDEQMVLAKEFFRSILYPGLRNENLAETRVRMYKNQKVKASEGIIPDHSSVEQHLKRSWLQSFIWRQCLERQIVFPKIDESGWKEEDGTTIPVWYKCSQFPPNMKDLEDNESVNDAMETSDDDNDSDGYQPLKKKDRSAEQEVILTNEDHKDDNENESDEGAISDDDEYDDDVSDSSCDNIDF
eukprot:gene16352-17996_t